MDADDELLRGSGGKVAKRDIVQFVEFKDAVKRGTLAEEVLKELPGQVTEYFELFGA